MKEIFLKSEVSQAHKKDLKEAKEKQKQMSVDIMVKFCVESKSE
jgi:hypothetical protein